jgi:hypothetical protein
MTLEDKQQKLLYTLLANHPILVWQKVNQMNEENSARRQPKKKVCFCTKLYAHKRLVIGIASLSQLFTCASTVSGLFF